MYEKIHATVCENCNSAVVSFGDVRPHLAFVRHSRNSSQQKFHFKNARYLNFCEDLYIYLYRHQISYALLGCFRLSGGIVIFLVLVGVAELYACGVWVYLFSVADRWC